MSAAGYELEVHRGQSIIDSLQNQGSWQSMNNCPQGLLGYTPHWVQTCPCPPNLSDFELTITQISADREPLLNYGAKLRLVMADPFKGIDLREAIAKLKIALKEAFKK